MIADILMPTMDGCELVRQLRADPDIARTPVIFCAAHYHKREALALARTCGVSGVIARPAEPGAVLSAVEAALGAAAPGDPPPSTEEFDPQHADLSAANERLSASIELNLRLASERDPQRLLEAFGRAARQIIGARYSITGILNQDGSRFRSLFTSGMDPETAARLGSPDPRAGVLRTILSDNRPVRLHHPDEDPAALGLASSHPPVHAWLGAPIASATRVYGYIGLIGRLGLDEFSREDERLAVLLAAQAGRLYHNGSLYAGVRAHALKLERELDARRQTERAFAERVRHASLVEEVGAILTASDTAREMLQLCAQALVRRLDVALARIWTADDTEKVLQLQASAGLYTGLDGPHGRIPFGKLAIGLIAEEGRPYLGNDMLAGAQGDDQEWMRRAGIASFAGCPLVVEDRLVGVVGIFERQPLGKGMLDTLVSIAPQIALGIHHKHAEQAVREREEHIRLLLDSTAEAIYGIDLEGRCTFANSACVRLLGYPDASRMLGRDMHDLIHHSRADGTPYAVDECRIYRAFRSDQGSHVDDEVLWRADGSSFPAEYWSYPVRRNGEVVGSVVTFLDITERRQLEARFRQAQQRLRHVVVFNPAVLFTLAVAAEEIQGINWVSDNLQEVFGYPPEAAIGTAWWMAGIHPEDLERVKAQTTADLFVKGRSTEEYRFRHGDGAYRWTRSDIRLVPGERHSPSEAVGAWSDITERKRAEEEQSKLREQLQQAQNLESIGRLAGGVAHDFNNLLTVINGHGSLLLKAVTPDDPTYESLTEIRTAGERAAALSQQLLLFSRKQVLQPKKVNLNEIVAEVEKMLASVIGEDIRIESVLNPSLGSVLADPGQLHQVLMNLAVNAQDAMPGGGRLLIETDNVDLDARYAGQHAGVEPGRYVELKVSDTGVGLTKEVMSPLFEPFFTTKAPGEGTGLGLATVYGIVTQSGGTIWVYSEPGDGTAFTIYLPRIDEPAKPDVTPEPGPPVLRGTETILVVEDQDQVRKMAAQILRGYGYRVLEAANPGEALLDCERYAGPIHLMLTDIVMPGISGPELAERMKAVRPSMEVLLMSGYSERTILRRRNLDLSGAYLPKPFSPEALAAKVREVLGPPRSARTILVVDDEAGTRNLIGKIPAGVGYRVLEAADGREAVRQIETTEIDLAIMDLAMPEQEGIETIGLLRRKHARLRIIAMSGRFPGMLRAAEAFGAQASIEKPIQPEELLNLVGRVIPG